MKKIISILMIAACFTIYEKTGYSQTSSDTESDAELDAEIRWLQEEAAVITTKIATKTEMDADIVPGIVTILQGEDLKYKGFRTVLDALSSVPGLDFSFSFGDPLIIVRGVGSTLGSGKLKLMLNNVPINNTLNGSGMVLYDIPVAQISRIEIIRGPGSALYGKWAYAGVINVHTKKDSNMVFGEYGSFDTWKAGALVSASVPEKDFDINLNVAGGQRGPTDIRSGPDSLAISPLKDFSYSPGPVNDSRDTFSAVLEMNYKDLSLLAQWTSVQFGDYFGVINLLPPPGENRPNMHRTCTAEAGWKPDITDNLSLDIRIGWREFVFEMERSFQVPSIPVFDDDGNVVFVLENDLRGGPYYKERSLYSGADIHWKGWKRHYLLLGAEYENTTIAETWHELNFHPVTNYPLTSFERFQGDENWMLEDRDRGIFSLYLQDQFEITDRLTLTGGLRYDSYDDTDNRLTPRIAGCFRATDHHIIKAQYSEAFRPPSFYEMYSRNNPTIMGNSDITPETVKTYEMGYIYKRNTFTGRITLFYSKLRDLIVVDNTEYYYKNIGKADTKGAEAEAEWKIRPYLTLNVSVSRADTEDESTGEEIQGSAPWLGNAGLLYNPSRGVTVSLEYDYVGKRNRAVNDPREELTSYQTLHTTLTFEDFLAKGLSLQGGIRNLFDEDVRYPATLDSYIDDYPQTGREWWMKFSYEF